MTPPFPIEAALEVPKKGRWDPKGKAIDPFGRGDAKRKQEAWADAVPLLVASLEKQPGCGKCLSSLAQSLTGAERYDDAVRVGEVLNKVYPDRKEGWQRISDTWDEAQRAEECIAATTKYLEIEKDDSNMWWRRNKYLLQLGQFDNASQWFAGAEAAGLPKEDVACLKIQLMAVQSDPVGARDLWSTCDLGENVDLRRYTEGWLALAEGDSELAAKRLVMSGADDFARLTIAFIRIEQGKFDMATNIAAKLFPKNDWALDAHLAHAEALHGAGRDAEAEKELQEHFLGPSWQERHKALTLEQMMLKPKGTDWPKEVGRRAVLTQLAILQTKGDANTTHGFYEEAIGVYGASEDLKKAAGEAATFAGPAGETVDAAYQVTLDAAIRQNLPKLQGCIDAERKKTPTLAGRIVPKLTVSATGAVKDPTLESTTLGNPAAEACIVKQLASLKLPAPPAGATVVATYPIEFASKPATP